MIKVAGTSFSCDQLMTVKLPRMWSVLLIFLMSFSRMEDIKDIRDDKLLISPVTYAIKSMWRMGQQKDVERSETDALILCKYTILFVFQRHKTLENCVCLATDWVLPSVT